MGEPAGAINLIAFAFGSVGHVMACQWRPKASWPELSNQTQGGRAGARKCSATWAKAAGLATHRD